MYEVTMHDWYIVQSLMDNQEIKKKIIFNGTKWVYPKLSDTVNCKFFLKKLDSLSLFQDNKQIYEKKNKTDEIDQTNYFEIEKRVIQNTKFGERSEITVKSVYMKDKNADMISHYKLDKDKNVVFKCEIHDIQQYEYVYNVKKDKFSKKIVLKQGFGKDSPDRESLVKLKLQIWHENNLLYDNFKDEKINNYLEKLIKNDEFEKLREEIIKKNNLIRSLD